MLVLENLGQRQRRIGRRLHRIELLGRRQEEIAAAIGARHQRHGLREQRLVVGSGGQLGAEELLQVLAARGAAHAERRVELALHLRSLGMLLEELRKPVVLGDHLVGHHLVGVLVVVAEVREVGHHGLRIGIVAAGLEGLAERLADAGAVVGLIGQVLAGLLIEDEGEPLLGVVAEILGAQVIDLHQRVDIGVLLGHVLGTVDLLLVNIGAALVDGHRSVGATVEQVAQVTGGRIVIAVVVRLLQEIAVQNVLLPLFRGVAPFRVLGATEILLCHRSHSEQRTGRGKQKFNVFHRSD